VSGAEGPPVSAVRQESTIVARWLGAVSLIAAAEDAARARVGALNIVAVASAHSATEVMLGLIASRRPGRPGPRFETFDALLKRATDALPPGVPLPDHLPSELINLNDVRNFALHRGVAVADSTAAEAALTARTLLDVLPLVVALEALPGGGGLTRAVARRIEDKRLREYLELAEDLFRANDHLGAATNLSGAFTLVIHRAELPSRDPSSRWSLPNTGGGLQRDPTSALAKAVDGQLAKLHESVQRDERWVRRIALGQSRATLARLETILGEANWGSGSLRTLRHGAPDPSIDDVAWAMARVTEIVYRLSVAGSLDLSFWERDQLARESAKLTETGGEAGPTA
jgi:hypothetical protein